jgi:predicted small metal-binding protein
MGHDCPWYARAENLDELMEKIEQHAETVHGITEISDEMMKEIKTKIKDE